MKTPSISTLALLLSASFVAAQSSSKPALSVEALQKQVNATKLFAHAVQLQKISDLSNGIRAHGSAGYNASVSYVKELLDATGFYHTEYQAVPYNSTVFTKTNFSESSGQSYGSFAVGMENSPAGVVTAPLVVVNDTGCKAVSIHSSLLECLFLILDSADRLPHQLHWRNRRY